MNIMSLNNYLTERSAALAASKRPAMIMTHVVCGYPSFEANWKALEIMDSFGVDLVELQFPFSEPSADGPLFVKANQKAISDGVHVNDCFEFMAKASAKFSFKIVMMGYYNTVFKTGHRAFMQRLVESGALGFILPDLPVEEAGELHSVAKELGLAPIVLMTPTNTDARLEELASYSDGFIYTVARKGVTGSGTDMNKEVSDFIRRCRNFTKLPLAVGFGVSESEHVKFIGQHADIAVIGTAALLAWETDGEQGLKSFFSQLLK
jgi:tryptophan synthase alpha chain